jgi:tRNA modification GTPase
LDALVANMGRHLDDGHRGERVREGYRIAIIGPPNAGKSSLLNALARREAAIVSEIPGTTRDVVEVRLVLAGFPVWIADTAGLREAADAIEAEGVRRALARAEEADLRIGVVEAGGEVPAEVAGALRQGDVLARSKADLRHPGETRSGEPGTQKQILSAVTPWVPDHASGVSGMTVIGVAAPSGIGLAELQALLTARVAAALGAEEAPALTRARHRRLVEEARAALVRALPGLDGAPELAAEDVRAAAAALGRLTGRIDVEDLLDEIFASFCIGK